MRRSLAPYESIPLQELLGRASRRYGHKTAVIDGEKSFTYGQMGEYSDRFACALAELGVAPGDRVAALAPNCAEFVIAFYGIIKAGAIVTTVNSGYREREIAHQLNDSGAETLVAHEALLPMANAALGEALGVRRQIVIGEGSSGSESFWDLIEGASGEVPELEIDPVNDVVALPYSSGTTGLSKGVMLTHYNLVSNTRQFLDRADERGSLEEDDVILTHLPLFHIYGLNVLMNGAIGSGATQVMMGRFDMEEFLSLLERHRVTVLFTVPPVGLGLTQYPGVAERDLSSLRLGFFGAAPLSAEMQRRIEEVMGFPIIQGYGMTEASPVTHADFAEPELARPGSIGAALPGHGAEGGGPGEWGVGSGARRDGRADGARSAGDEGLLQQRRGDGGDAHRGRLAAHWGHSSDGRGRLRVGSGPQEGADQVQGLQVPPAELEGVLLEHPGIADAAVIGKDDLESGEIPKAFVVLRPGAELSGEEVMSFAASKVATFKRVREVEFIDAVPKNPSGKILRRALIERERGRS